MLVWLEAHPEMSTLLALLTVPEIAILLFLIALAIVCMRTSGRGAKK